MANIEMNVLKVGDSEFEIADAQARQDVSDLKEDLTAAQAELAKKANTDGYYQDMTVGDAEQLVASQYVEDSVPYNFRTTGGSADVGNREYVDAVVGGSIVWNQIVNNGNFGVSGSWFEYACTYTFADGVATVTPTESLSRIFQSRFVVLGHKYLMVATFKGTSGEGNAMLSWYGGVNEFVPFDGSWQTVSLIVNNTFQTSNVWQLHYGSSQNANKAPYMIKDAVCIDLTQMFGSTIADYIYSLEQATAGAGVAWFKKLFPKDYYEYNAGELLSVSGLASHDTVGFNELDITTFVKGRTDNGVIGYAFGTTDMTIGTDLIAFTTNTGYRGVVSGKIPVIPNANYVYSSSDDGSCGSYFDAYSSDDGWIQRIAATNYIVTGKRVYRLVTPSNCAYVRVSIQKVTEGSVTITEPSFHLEWSGWRNGEYEAYQKHSYPLDSSLTLRGIPKLDAQNNLYYDGDEYLPDGTVNRRYGIVDLGTLTWSAQGTANCFYTNGIASVAKVPTNATNPNLLINGYTNHYAGYNQLENKEYRVDGSASSLYIGIKNTDCSTPAEMKTALSGVLLVYELATPTAETAEPYQHVQICDDFGTEEYVSTSIVPVGHNTRYPANLRDKLQHLPDLADDDGYYMIGQSNKQMHLELFRIPKAPTDDGTYTLKATVSGGTPTYTWEAQT